MKILELSQEELDVLWTATISQESVENVLMQAATDASNYYGHRNRMIACERLRDKIREQGVTGISL